MSDVIGPSRLSRARYACLLRWPGRQSGQDFRLSKHSRLYFHAKSPETYTLREAERSVQSHPWRPHRAGAGGYGSGHQFRGHLALLAGWPANSG